MENRNTDNSHRDRFISDRDELRRKPYGVIKFANLIVTLFILAIFLAFMARFIVILWEVLK